MAPSLISAAKEAASADHSTSSKLKSKFKKAASHASNNSSSSAASSSSNPTFDGAHAKAARALLDADYLLVCAGAGFSADSGLPVYKDIADLAAYHKRQLTYADLCTPQWAQREPEIFFGFWGSCYNSYFETAPHEGYRIISRWRDAVVGKQLLQRRAASARTTRERSLRPAAPGGSSNEPPPPTATPPRVLNRIDPETGKVAPIDAAGNPTPGFVFTSNVDCFFRRSGWAESQILEIHGNVQRYS